MSDDRLTLRHVPRVHAAWCLDGGAVEHASAPAGEASLCGLREGAIVRHLFEDVARARSCPSCQGLADAIAASDLLDAIAGAVRRGDLADSAG